MGERRPRLAAAREVTHAGSDDGEETGSESLAHDRHDAGLLRPQGEGRVLRGDGEGGVLRPEPAGVELRLPLETEGVWNEFHGRLRAYVGRRVRDGADADDIVQKVFLEIHRGLPRLRRRERLGAWLFRAAHNAVVDHYRSPVRRREVAAGGAGDLETALADRPGADEADGSESIGADCLRPIVAILRSADRETIEAVELTGIPQKVAAERAGISLTAMKARIRRARRRLKEALLECCAFVLDARGGVMDCAARPRSGPACRGAATGRECHDA
jgi:RNA polymerase sigma-70 factor, ECF subfamily